MTLLISALFLFGGGSAIESAASTNSTPEPARTALPAMHWADDSPGRSFSKDPSVVRFGGRYLMY